MRSLTCISPWLLSLFLAVICRPADTASTIVSKESTDSASAAVSKNHVDSISAFISMAGDCRYPAVASEGTNLYLAWVASEGRATTIFFRRSMDEGREWNNGRRISIENGVCYPPAIAAHGGIVHLAWVDYGETVEGEIYYARSVDGGETWEQNTILHANANSARYPLLTCQGREVYLVWQDVENKTYFKVSHNQGQNWETEKLLAKLGRHSCYCYPPAICANGKEVTVVWTDVQDVKKGFKISAYGIPLVPGKSSVISAVVCRKSTDAGSTWGKEKILVKTEVAKEAKDEIDNPAMLSDGSVSYLFWIDKSIQKLGEIKYAKFDAATTKFPISGKDIYPGQKRSPKRPSVILDSDNNFHLAWASFLGGKSVVCYGRSDGMGNILMEKKGLTSDTLRYHNPILNKTPSGLLQVFWFDEPVEKDGWSRIFLKRSQDNGLTWLTWEPQKKEVQN